MTPALSSKYIKTPSFRRIGFLCLMITAGITAKQNTAIIASFTGNVFHAVKKWFEWIPTLLFTHDIKIRHKIVHGV